VAAFGSPLPKTVDRQTSKPAAGPDAQDSQLVAQDDDLEFLELSRSAQKANEL
jgi:hypothetical protein